MWTLVLVLVVSAKEQNLIEQEIDEITRLQDLLRRKEKSLEDLENSLVSAGVEIPTGNSWKAIPGLVPSPLDFTFYDKLVLEDPVKCIEFVPSKGIFAITDKGFYAFSQNAKINNRIAITHAFESCVISSFGFALVSKTSFRVGSLGTNSTDLSVGEEISLFNDSSLSATSAIDYSYNNKKYWVFGDSKGGISLFTSSGEFKSRGVTEFSSIAHIDKVRHDLLITGDRSVGLFSLASMKINEVCENAAGRVLSAVFSTKTPQLLYAAVENGDILQYDTKYSGSGSSPTCKPVYRYFNKYSSEYTSLGFLQEWLVGWDGRTLSLFESTDTPAFHYTIDFLETSKDSWVKVHENTLILANGSTVVIATANFYSSFEVESDESSFDFMDMRILAIVMGVGIVVVYRLYNRKTEEGVGKRLDKIQRSLEENEMMGGNKKEKKKHVRFSNQNQTRRYELDNESDSS